MKTLLIEKQHIRSNIATVVSRAGSSLVYAVLKGNAYGLGLLEVAEICREEGISHFALTETEDAVLLRERGFDTEEILMLRPNGDRTFVEALADYSLVGTIGSQDVAVAINGIAAERKTVIKAHVKVDTGMGRYGFLPSEFEKIVSVYKNLTNVEATGIYTHFPRAYDNEKLTRLQADQFADVVGKLRARAIEPGLVHAAGSSALFRYDFCHFDAVRVGSAITGRLPSRMSYGFQRVGVLVSAVSEVRWLPKNATVGYGSVYKTRQPMRIAIIPVGYADGYCTKRARDSYRARDVARYMLSELKQGLLQKKMYVSINGQPAQVVGRVGMLHTAVDVTNMDCSSGDLALFDINPIFAAGISRTYE